MNRIYTILGVVTVAGTLVACSDPEARTASAPAPEARVVGLGSRGEPNFVTGRLAQAPVPSAWKEVEGELAPALERIAPVFGLDPGELALKGAWTDELGFGHARYARSAHGLPVVGAELLVHVDETGRVYAANGEGFGAITVEPTASVQKEAARSLAVQGSGERAAGGSRLVYFVSQMTGRVHLAWEIEVAGRAEDGLPVDERVFVDAIEPAIVGRHSRVYEAKYRKVYDARNNSLRRSEGQAPVSDAVVNAAYDNTGTTYDCYWNLFQRDSFDGQGAQLISYVHDSQVYMNAAWYNGTMLFGDGDGQDLDHLAYSLDVTAHEITHGVVERTANLAYEYESGALNEAWADIMAATCEAYADGGAISADTWKVGEDVYTPNTPGDALRYMNNPTIDGQSYDYWPERYLIAAAPSEQNDMGGVHLNSGIGNLAYYLAVSGGRHPRNKTTFTVAGVGLAQARGAFYRALTTYMTANTTFQGARLATMQAAEDLHGATVAQAVDQAWAAVGVPPTLLQSGSIVTPLSGNALTRLYFAVAVPSGSTNLSITTTGGTGDCDLYVKLGAAPSAQLNDYESKGNTSAESITVPTPGAGTWYVLLEGYSDFSGVRLTVSFDEHNLTLPPKPSLPPPAPTL